ncbi:hypothetical protein V8E36_008890 [Tilletia maclaganii]
MKSARALVAFLAAVSAYGPGYVSAKNNYYGIALSPYQKLPSKPVCGSIDELNTIVANISQQGFKAIQLEYLGHDCSPPAVSTVYKAAKANNVLVQPTLFLDYSIAGNASDFARQSQALLDAVAAYPNVTDTFLFGGEAINRRIDTEENLRKAFFGLVKKLASKGFTGKSTINEPVDASLAVAMCDLDFLALSLDPWYEYDPPGPTEVTRWSLGRINNMLKICPGADIQITRFGWTSNATAWGPIEPSKESMGGAFKTINDDAAANGTLAAYAPVAWEYDDQLWKFATDQVADQVGTFVERYYGLFDKADFDFDKQVVGEA